LVPPQDIKECKGIVIPERWIQEVGFKKNDTPTEKGNKAIEIVMKLLKGGWFPLSLFPQVITDMDMQIEGTDLIVRAERRIQVKCDYDGGPKTYGGTGNLFLQIAECNPFQQF
jgi:hypothetical protein